MRHHVSQPKDRKLEPNVMWDTERQRERRREMERDRQSEVVKGGIMLVSLKTGSWHLM